MSIWTPMRAAGARLFFRHFGRLLFLAASAAQWAVGAWVANLASGWSPSWWLNGLAVGGLYAFNCLLVSGRLRLPRPALRFYTAMAFVALFCAAFLLASAVVFAVAHGALGVLSAQALTVGGQATLGAGLNGAFRWLATAGMAVIALALGYGYTFGQRALRVTRIPVVVPGVATPLRIAQISDIHIGQNLSHAQLRSFVARVNASQPDLICITGDIADSPLADLSVAFPLLDGLRARFGVCAILGNHDHYAGADRVVEALRRYTSFHVLRDSAVTLDCGGGRLHVIGLDDRGRDWARGLLADRRLDELLGAAPPDTPVVLLTHRPDIFRQAAAAAVPLTLSGHTHGGQLGVPWFDGRRRNLAQFITPFSRGLYRAGDSYLYVNCGLGVTGQRIRLFTPREISVFELTPA